MHTSMKMRKGPEYRAKALAIAMKRKEEYLGARVPKELKERVIRRAEELDLPVSMLIRKVLEDAFGGQGRSSFDPKATAEPGEAERAGRFPSVLGWETIRLNKSALCAGCGCRLKPGEQITMGIASPGEERILLCDVCKESL